MIRVALPAPQLEQPVDVLRAGALVERDHEQVVGLEIGLRADLARLAETADQADQALISGRADRERRRAGCRAIGPIRLPKASSSTSAAKAASPAAISPTTSLALNGCSLGPIGGVAHPRHPSAKANSS